jgi:small subunit ribosomal protein S8
MSTDNVADMLTKLRNANLVKHQIVQLPTTKIALNLAEILVAEGFIDSFEELNYDLKKSLLLSLKYVGKERRPSMSKVKRISRPGLRVYFKAKRMPRILDGFGTGIVSTSRGLMTDEQARKEGVGGELLCYIW